VNDGAHMRDKRLDALRGFFLISMAGMHVPSPMSDLLRDSFGYSSAAEGFIFLSACLAGLVYGRTYARSDWPTMARRVWNRVKRIYWVHLGVIIPAVLTAWLFAGRIVPLANHFHDFLVHPWGALALIPLLLHQPPLFDILPLYVLGLGVTPWLLAIARRRGWRPILVVSALVWLLEQVLFLGNFHVVNDPAQWLPFRWGSFDPFAWQLLWIGGLALGETAIRQPGPRVAPEHRVRFMAPALAALLVCFLLRHFTSPTGWLSTHADVWSDKWTLGPLRLLDFGAWVALMLAWNPRPPEWVLMPTALLGRHSLAVFAFHLPLVITAVTIIQVYALSNTGQVLVSLTVIALLYPWVMWLERDRRQAIRVPATADALPRLPLRTRSTAGETFPAAGVRPLFPKARGAARTVHA